ncbi:MAG: hypothetical protein J0M00_14855 [Burkholderiales bacterium]|nr:hypothetical protein [Burkholderiales bacterium]
MNVSELPTLLASLSAAGPLEQAKFWISVVGLVSLVGILTALVSLRLTVCNQIYARWQSLIFKFADTEGAHAYLVATEYAPGADRPPAHYIAVGYMNLFEEAYRYHKAKMFIFFVPVLPNAFWYSIENSMKKQLRQFKYLRTYWQQERSSFSGDFNHHVQYWVRPFDGAD